MLGGVSVGLPSLLAAVSVGSKLHCGVVASWIKQLAAFRGLSAGPADRAAPAAFNTGQCLQNAVLYQHIVASPGYGRELRLSRVGAPPLLRVGPLPPPFGPRGGFSRVR